MKKYYVPIAIAVAGVAVLAALLVSFNARNRVSRLEDTVSELALQAALIQGVFQGPLASELNGVVEELDSFQTSTISFEVDIDETISVDTDFTLQRTVQVPIVATVPIREELDTTITIAGPLGVDIPLNVTVPVNVDVPIDLVVDIPIDETVPISTNIPVRLTVPIDVAVAGSPLADLAAALSEALGGLANAL
ncbi:MAG: hypothetical protein OEM94_00475 [Acidimicrobiia bacterium]|nr:hypothetical protein [Acidimicrobiia bacterium]